jgi:hypothetical protein
MISDPVADVIKVELRLSVKTSFIGAEQPSLC